MHPLARLLIPAATSGDDVQMRVVLTIAAMGLDDDDVTAFEVLAADTAKDIIQTSDPTAHERAQYSVRLPIKRLPEYRGHGQHYMAIDDALMQHPADLADPV